MRYGKSLGLRRSPDGSLFLARAESHVLHIFDASDFRCIQTYRAPTPVLDVSWYLYPATADDEHVHWCFAVSGRDMPVRLVDARTGEVRRAAHAVESDLCHGQPYRGVRRAECTCVWARLYTVR